MLFISELSLKGHEYHKQDVGLKCEASLSFKKLDRDAMFHDVIV